jgi:hypothetical protein
MTDINIKNLLKKNAITVEEFPGFPGFRVTLAYPGREVLEGIRKSSVVSKLNRKTHTVEEELDQEKFVHKYVEAVVKNWDGLTVGYLQELALVDSAGLDPEDLIPFTIDNAVALMQNSPAFDNWIAEVSVDMENFTKAK